MKDDEVVVAAGPRNAGADEYNEVVVESLRQAGMAARVVETRSVAPERRPDGACTPGHEVYLVVASRDAEAAHEVIKRAWRICLACDAMLLAEAHSCQRCGATDDRSPGPNPDWPGISLSSFSQPR